MWKMKKEFKTLSDKIRTHKYGYNEQPKFIQVLDFKEFFKRMKFLTKNLWMEEIGMVRWEEEIDKLAGKDLI